MKISNKVFFKKAVTMKNLNGNTLLIKEVNINIIREAVRGKTSVTKPQIAKETGLTTVTVGTILNELLEANEILEVSQAKSTGGRPPKEYRYNFDLFNCLTIFPFEKDSETYISITISNLGKNELYNEIRKVEKIDLETLKSMVSYFLKEYPKIKVVGFGNTGINAGDEIIFSDYKDLTGLNLAKELEIPVVIENDVNSAAIGFHKRKELSSEENLVYLFFPETYPPGSAILINNELYRGNRNCAGEIASIKRIKWDNEVYNNFDRFCKNSVEIIEILAAILNPDTCIFSGNFITEEHINEIRKLCNETLDASFVPEIFLTKNFIDDIKSGLKELSINKIFPQTILTRKTE